MPHANPLPVARSNGNHVPGTESWAPAGGSQQPFLSDTQRAALDAALAAKMTTLTTAPSNSADSSTSLQSRASLKVPRKSLEGAKSQGEIMFDRKSRSEARKGSTRAAKKNGAGGKYTWGSVMDGEDDMGPVDWNDPNYDSGGDQGVSYHLQISVEIKQYKQAVAHLLAEYFVTGDLAEAAAELEDMAEPELQHFLVKRAVATALDKHNREREMTSVLLSSLYSEVISPEQMQKGFLSLVQAVDDLQIDVPDAPNLIATFVARAVIDDILPPSFVERLPSVVTEEAVGSVKARAEVLLRSRHAAERMLRCWGSGAGLVFEETREAIKNLLLEAVSSDDMGEARLCLRNLAVPFFHHQLVKQALLMAMESVPAATPLLELLKRLAQSGDISPLQMQKGFQRVADHFNDTCLDNPKARELFPAIVSNAQSAGWLESSFQMLDPSSSSSEALITAGSAALEGVATYKACQHDAILEYFASRQVGEVVRRMVEKDEPGFAHIFVKQVVTMAMDRKDPEREATSVLLAQLYPKMISQDQMVLGFTRLLASIEDTCLDFPDAAHSLSLFLGRAVIDEALQPTFLTSVLPSLKNDSLGVAVVRAVSVTLGARHAAERLQNCWHGGARTTAALRESMAQFLAEYVVSGDIEEASRCLAELSVPHFHHELVKRALLAAFGDSAHAAALLQLLAALSKSGQVNQTQMKKGFARVEIEMSDIKLDYPRADDLLADFKHQALQAGWLTVDPEEKSTGGAIQSSEK